MKYAKKLDENGRTNQSTSKAERHDAELPNFQKIAKPKKLLSLNIKRDKLQQMELAVAQVSYTQVLSTKLSLTFLNFFPDGSHSKALIIMMDQ